MGAMAPQITSLTIFRRRSKKTSKLRVTGLCVGNSPVTGEFPAQMASNAENVSSWWRHHVLCHSWLLYPLSWCDLTRYGFVTPYGNIDLSQQSLRSWLVTWRHQAITWTNVDLSTWFWGTYPRSFYQEVLKISIRRMSSKNSLVKITSTTLWVQWVEMKGCLNQLFIGCTANVTAACADRKKWLWWLNVSYNAVSCWRHLQV